MRATCMLLATALAALVVAPDPAVAASRGKKTQAQPIEARPADGTWVVVAEPGATVPFRGQADFDQAGSGARSGVLYPGDSGAVFLGALFTHAVVEKSVRSRERTRIQETANHVLSPYRSLIEGLDFVALLQQAIAMTPVEPPGVHAATVEQASSDWVVELSPAFVVAPAGRAMVLEATAVVRPRTAVAQAGYTHSLIVVSEPVLEAEPESHWLASDGERFRETAAQLISRALDIAVSRAARGAVAQGSMQTIRFQQGALERIERVQLVEEGCDRTLAKTLRGAWLSVPRRPTQPVSGQCDDSAAAVASATDEAAIAP